MKRLFLMVSMGWLALASLVTPCRAQASDEGQDPAPAGIVCLPGTYASAPDDCLAGGPSTYLTDMARQGMRLPLSPLPARRADPALRKLDTFYVRVNRPEVGVNVYGSLEEAMNSKKGQAAYTISSGFTYLSFIEKTVVEGKSYYQIEAGAWINSANVTYIGAFPSFQGVTFIRSPEHAFGWVINYQEVNNTHTKRTPGYEANDYTEHVIKNYELVQIYAAQRVKDMDWYLVAPDEWLPRHVVIPVRPDLTPPEGVTGERWISVNLEDQTLMVYDHHQLVFSTVVATGAEPFWTRPGLFQIKQKLASTVMRGPGEGGGNAYYIEDVPWTMYFDGARALHGAYWRTNMGYVQSHGCVNLTVGDARWLFDWAREGDWVYVWDPSGKTPTDPNLYSGGGY